MFLHGDRLRYNQDVLPPLFTDQPKDFLAALGQAHRACGDVFRLKFGSKDTYVLAHPDLAYEVLVKQKEAFGKLGSEAGLAKVLGKGILTNAQYDSWFLHRRVLQPAFHKEAVASWARFIQEAGERLLSRWRELPQDSVVDLAQEMLATTHEILYQLVFSLLPSEAKHYPIFLPLTLVSERTRVIREAKASVDAAIYTLIAERRKDKGKSFNDLLELLLETQDANTNVAMSDEEIRDELATVFAAGHDTTSYALTWTLYLLSQNPAVLATLQREVDAVESVSLLTLESLPYTLATFKEGLRLYPTIPSMPRLALQATMLAGYDIPRGARLFVSIYLLHRHPEFWPDAATFSPERFLQTSQPKAYLPFGLGERYCLGKNLALLQGQLLLAMMVKHFDVSLASDHDVSPKVSVSLFPKNGMRMTIRSRD
jgi:cytochrome P450